MPYENPQGCIANSNPLPGKVTLHGGKDKAQLGGDFRWDSILAVTKGSNPVIAGFISPYAHRTACFSLLVHLAEAVRFAATFFRFNTM